jgi:hypothetical protein
MDLHYSDGIAAARTTLALEANPAALQRRLPSGWELAAYAGEDLRGRALRGANLLVPFHEVYAVRHREGQSEGKPAGLAQLSYIAFVSQARNLTTGELGHVHWFTYTEDPTGVPGKYGDATLADITRSQTFTKEQRGQTQVRETFSAVAEGGQLQLSLAYRQGGMVVWATAEEPTCRCMPPRTRAWCAGTRRTRCWTQSTATRWASTTSPRSACRCAASWPTSSTAPSASWPCSSNGPTCGRSTSPEYGRAWTGARRRVHDPVSVKHATDSRRRRGTRSVRAVMLGLLGVSTGGGPCRSDPCIQHSAVPDHL